MMNNFNYDDRQINSFARYQHGLEACKVVNVNKDFGLELEAPNRQKFKLYPKDFEIFDYKIGMYVDCILRKENGTIVAAERIGMTPDKFVPAS